MLKRLAVAGGLAIAALGVTALLFGTVLAAGPGPKGGASIGGQEIPLAVASELTGLSEEELLAELEGGKTIPVLLEEMGIDLSVFHQAVAEARQTAVDEAVAAGEITPEQAQRMFQHMAESSEGPHGPGYGEGRMLGDGTGDGDQHRYGESGEGKSWGEPSHGTGDGDQHRYGSSTQ